MTGTALAADLPLLAARLLEREGIAAVERLCLHRPLGASRLLSPSGDVLTVATAWVRRRSGEHPADLQPIDGAPDPAELDAVWTECDLLLERLLSGRDVVLASSKDALVPRDASHWFESGVVALVPRVLAPYLSRWLGEENVLVPRSPVSPERLSELDLLVSESSGCLSDVAAAYEALELF